MRGTEHAVGRLAADLSPSPSACRPAASSCRAQEAGMEPSKLVYVFTPVLGRGLCAVQHDCVTVRGTELSRVPARSRDGFASGSVLTSVEFAPGVVAPALRCGGYAISRFVSGACRCACVVVLGASSGAQAFVPQTGPSGDAEVR